MKCSVGFTFILENKTNLRRTASVLKQDFMCLDLLSFYNLLASEVLSRT